MHVKTLEDMVLGMKMGDTFGADLSSILQALHFADDGDA